MKLSAKGRYAVMAMADIAHVSDGAPVSLADITLRQGISQAYLEQIFAKLRRRGLVESARGPGGGYRLARSAEEIPIADIVLAVEEPLRITRCKGGARGCVAGARCLTHDLWDALGRQIQIFLAAVSLADVIHRRRLSLTAPLLARHNNPAAAN
jgi:Rrf2 family iron-sulfur cluster assembly transcriptional regulator